MGFRGRLALALLALVWSGDAEAHKTSLTRSEVSVSSNQVHYLLKVSPHDIAVAVGIPTDLKAPIPQSRFEARAADLRRYVTDRIRISADGATCPAMVETAYGELPDWLNFRTVFTCPAPPEALEIAYDLFFDIDSAHRSLGRMRWANGDDEEFLFDRTLRRLSFEIASPAPLQSRIERFQRVLKLGIEHILLGVDHLLFLLVLIATVSGLWPMVKIVTAFTVAHSLSLALAWYGVIDLPPRLVETAIALSIAYVAAENLMNRGRGHRWLVAGGFGLVHGLGFFRALKDLGLASGDALTTLLAFNLGVEVGQLVFVAAISVPLAWSRDRPWFPMAARGVSVAVLVIAIWWGAERAFMV